MMLLAFLICLTSPRPPPRRTYRTYIMYGKTSTIRSIVTNTAAIIPSLLPDSFLPPFAVSLTINILYPS